GRKVSATDHKDYDKGERTTSVRKKGRFGRTKTVEKTTMMKSSAFFDEFVQILK
ncbi:MAG: hypothetical protein H8D23_12030, partial [Candidatus Brocadiales bacterium]|nr:hypothetical protein [Candidatus Brocadiales bacterium]